MKIKAFFPLLLLLSACSGKVSINSKKGSSKSSQVFSLQLPFNFGNESSYQISDINEVEFTSSGIARLKPADQVDDDNSTTGFLNATQTGTQWDSTNNYLRLNTTTNNAELDSSWTPQWNNLVWYWKMNGGGQVSVTPFTPDVGVGPCTFLTNTGYFDSGKVKNSVRLGNVLHCGPITSSHAIYNVQSQATIMGWIKIDPANANTWGSLFETAGATYGIWVQRYNTNNTLYFGSTTSAGSYGSAELPVLDGKWHHIVGVWNNGTIKTYMDGNLFSTQNYPYGSGFDFTNGSSYFAIRNTTTGADTNLDEWAMWQTALSDAEVDLSL